MTLGFRKNGSELKHVVGGRWQKEQQQQQKKPENSKSFNSPSPIPRLLAMEPGSASRSVPRLSYVVCFYQ